eukprot:67772-Rhodomonas_salina.1
MEFTEFDAREACHRAALTIFGGRVTEGDSEHETAKRHKKRKRLITDTEILSRLRFLFDFHWYDDEAGAYLQGQGMVMVV